MIKPLWPGPLLSRFLDQLDHPDADDVRTKLATLHAGLEPGRWHDRWMRIEPYAIAVPDAVIDDLRDRIRRTRWPDPAPGEPWSQGADLDYLRDLLAYWADGFDWRSQERWLNRFEHRMADVDGVASISSTIGAGGGRPLVLTHGWPSTFVELLSLVDRLGDRFDLVVPSLPGYAFSPRPPARGSTGRTSRACGTS